MTLALITNGRTGDSSGLGTLSRGRFAVTVVFDPQPSQADVAIAELDNGQLSVSIVNEEAVAIAVRNGANVVPVVLNPLPDVEVSIRNAVDVLLAANSFNTDVVAAVIGNGLVSVAVVSVPSVGVSVLDSVDTAVAVVSNNPTVAVSVVDDVNVSFLRC